ncbi:MAG TPA: hypothetical protein VGO59_04150 [Verrucomicrobiae bacterium]
MKITYRSGLGKFASAAALAVLLPLAISSTRAASVPSTLDADGAVLQQAQPRRVAAWWTDAKRTKLRHAYWLLEQGDRDYAGHRLAAMKDIKKAAALMGMDLKGEGYSGEHQKWSDERLREARKSLDEVVDKSGGREHAQIRAAIKELDRALEAH